MKITQDWHIHSEYSCDDACLKMEDLVAETEQIGILDYGVSDHLHTGYNTPDIINSRKHYESVISKNPALKGKFHFGIEISCVSQWELDKISNGDYNHTENITYGIRSGGPKNAAPAIAADSSYIEENGIEYVIGGVHWPLYCDYDRESLLKDYHRQYMFLAQHKNVNILAHYLWWMPPGPEVENPFADFSNIPKAMKRELAFALKENNCAFELNLCAVLLASNVTEKFKREYLDYAVEIQSMGVSLAIGGDCHSRHYTEIDFEFSSKMLEASGIDLDGNMFYIKK